MEKSTIRRAAGVLLAATVFAAALVVASGASPRFFDDDPIWEEPNTQDASGASPWTPDLLYDLTENLFTRPGDPEFGKRAENVNTVDEVPDGSWFENRAAMRPLTARDVARGPNTGEGPRPGTWTVVASKSDGITPGFTIHDASGDVYFIKFDPPGRRAMATGTEVAISKLFWALGYHVGEYYIATLRREDLAIGEGATIAPPAGKRHRMHESDLDWLLAQAERDPDGTYRVIASKALPGRFLGAFSFHGTRPDDPNDVVPHENRRELRGYGVFAAWFNHVDAKAGNTADTLVSENDRSVIRHYLLDFGSTMGSAAVGPRDYWEGDEYMVQPGDIGKGIAGLGFYILPWRTKPVYEHDAIGRINRDDTNWDPEDWRPRVPNAAFIRARADDKFWAARRAAAITDEMIGAAVAEGRFGDQKAQEALVRSLEQRRNAIVRRYLTAVNPVIDPALDASGALTFGNAAVAAGVSPEPEGYHARWAAFDNATGDVRPIGETSGAKGRIAAPAGLPDANGAYLRVAVSAVKGANAEWEKPVHAFFRRAPEGWKLVGFDRLPDGPSRRGTTD